MPKGPHFLCNDAPHDWHGLILNLLMFNIHRIFSLKLNQRPPAIFNLWQTEAVLSRASFFDASRDSFVTLRWKLFANLQRVRSATWDGDATALAGRARRNAFERQRTRISSQVQSRCQRRLGKSSPACWRSFALRDFGVMLTPASVATHKKAREPPVRSVSLAKLGAEFRNQFLSQSSFRSIKSTSPSEAG